MNTAPENPLDDAKPARKQTVAELRRELQARSAEADWLKAHYEEQLRLAWTEVETLRSRRPEPAAGAEAGGLDAATLEGLRAELVRLTEAEARYLDRIEELKEMLASGGSSS